MKAVIKLDVPEWQIGEEVQVFFPDSMCKKGICEPTVERQYFPPCEDCHKKMDDIRRAYDKARARPQGEWIDICTLPAMVKCSHCGTVLGVAENISLNFNFCPNCGAKMDKEADNEDSN